MKFRNKFDCLYVHNGVHFLLKLIFWQFFHPGNPWKSTDRPTITCETNIAVTDLYFTILEKDVLKICLAFKHKIFTVILCKKLKKIRISRLIATTSEVWIILTDFNVFDISVLSPLLTLQLKSRITLFHLIFSPIRLTFFGIRIKFRVYWYIIWPLSVKPPRQQILYALMGVSPPNRHAPNGDSKFFWTFTVHLVIIKSRTFRAMTCTREVPQRLDQCNKNMIKKRKSIRM